MQDSVSQNHQQATNMAAQGNNSTTPVHSQVTWLLRASPPPHTYKVTQSTWTFQTNMRCTCVLTLFATLSHDTCVWPLINLFAVFDLCLFFLFVSLCFQSQFLDFVRFPRILSQPVTYKTHHVAEHNQAINHSSSNDSHLFTVTHYPWNNMVKLVF